MTPSEFANTIRAKHPGAYNDMDDAALTAAVLTKYPQYHDLVSTGVATPTGFPEPQVTDNPPAGAEVPVEQRFLNNVNTVGAGMGLGALGAGGIDAIADGLKSLGGAAVDAAKGVITTPRSLGLTEGVAKTPWGAENAGNASDFVLQPHPELQNAAAQVGGVDASDVPEFSPIKQGLNDSAEDMLSRAEQQTDLAGRAVENAVSSFNDSGTQFDTGKFIKGLDEMFERDVNGKVLPPDVSSKNADINDVINRVKAYAGMGPGQSGDVPKIDWDKAAQLKKMLREGVNFRNPNVSGQVAGSLNSAIDTQAQAVVPAEDLQRYNMLKQQYGQLATIQDGLTNARAKETIAGTLPQRIWAATKSSVKHVVPGAALLGAIYKGLS